MCGKRVKKGRRRGERKTKDRGTGEEEGRKGERGGEHREEEKERRETKERGKNWRREKTTNKFIFWCFSLGIPDQGIIHDLFCAYFL